MVTLESRIGTVGELSAVVVRADGSTRDCGILGRSRFHYEEILGKLRAASPSFLTRMYHKLRGDKVIPATISLAAFLAWAQTGDTAIPLIGGVTQAGINYMMADFLSASSARINAFNYHDSGTGTTAFANSQTALVLQAGPATRATGTQSNPASGQYRSVGTISYTSALAITEWGVFSQAAQGGTMWERQTFAAVNVANGDSIQFTYTLTGTAS